MTLARALGSFAMTLTLAGSAGCVAEDRAASDPAESEGATVSTASLDAADARTCEQRQRRLLIGLNGLVQRLTVVVLARPEVTPTDVLERLERRVDEVDRRTRQVCEEAPLDTLRSAVNALPQGTVAEPALRQVVDAFEAWGESVAPAQWARIVYHRDPCVPMMRNVDVDFRVRYEPDEGGKRAWVQYTVENDWWMEVYVDHGGEVAARGLRPDGDSAVYIWGGSSADTAGGRPGAVDERTVSLVAVPLGARDPALTRRGKVRLLADGSLRVSDFSASAYSRVGLPSCDVSAAAVS